MLQKFRKHKMLGVRLVAKKIFKSLSLGVIVFVAAILVGYLSYHLTYRKQTEELQQRLMADELVSAAALRDETTDGETIRVAHYLARLENQDIAIYMVTENDVKFLYHLDIYAGNFPAEELLRLKEGIVLRNRQELAAFEEDYTS